MITDPDVSGEYALAATLENHSPRLGAVGITAKSQARNVAGPITFTNLPFTTRRQNIFLLPSLDVRTGRGTVRGRRAREKIRRHDFGRIAVLGEAE